MSGKLVTLNQVKSIQQMANEKRIGRVRFQKALDNGTISRFLDGLKNDASTIVSPPGARIHTIHVRVKQDRPWQDAVGAAGPNTPNEYNVRKVGDLYAPVGTGDVERDLVLLNYPKGDGNWDMALAWARTQGLKNTVPREVFAVGEQHPKLHEQLGINPMYVVATTECIFGGDRQACYVWWDSSGREAILCWVGRFDCSHGWFAFGK